MKNILLPLGLLAIGGLLIATNKNTIKSDFDRKQLKEWIRINSNGPGDLTLINVIDKMLDFEVRFLIDYFINKKFSQPYSQDVINQFNLISEKYNIFT